MVMVWGGGGGWWWCGRQRKYGISKRFLFSSSSVSVDMLDYLYHVYGRTLTAQLEAEASTSSNDAN